MQDFIAIYAPAIDIQHLIAKAKSKKKELDQLVRMRLRMEICFKGL